MSSPLNLPNPPDPSQYPGNPVAWQRAMYDWMAKSKSMLVDAHRSATKPCGQQFQVSTYTTTTAVTGTTTGTDLANALCSLIAALTARGIISPTISREQNQ